MLYIRKTGTILVPTLHEHRSVADRVFVSVWTALGGHFKAARIGVNTSAFLTPRYALKKKRRVYITATAGARHDQA
jgi:hypothetical protein